MSKVKSSDDQRAGLTYGSMQRISEIENELLGEWHQSVVIVILIAFVLGLVLGGFAAYAIAGERETWASVLPMVEKTTSLPLGR